jgi:hypothetical protein
MSDEPEYLHRYTVQSPASFGCPFFDTKTPYFVETYQQQRWARGGAVFETLRYKPEGRGIDFRLCHWNFLLT